MDQVGELDRILNEEDRDIVADQIPIAFLRVELDREAAHIARQIGRTLRSRDGRKAHESGHLLPHALQHIGARHIAQRFRQLEIAMRAIAAGMNDALWNALMVEVKHLLAKMHIFQQRRPTRALFQRILIVRDGNALGGRQGGDITARNLMRLAALRLRFGINVGHAIGGRRRRGHAGRLLGDLAGCAGGFVCLGHENSSTGERAHRRAKAMPCSATCAGTVCRNATSRKHSATLQVAAVWQILTCVITFCGHGLDILAQRAVWTVTGDRGRDHHYR